jgi:hypothetical protein
MNITDAVRHISKGIDDDLKYHIKKELMAQAEKIVDEITEKLLHNLKANLVSYNKFDSDKIEISLTIDGVQKNIKEDKK